MILYLDSSALVKLYIEEDGSADVERAVEEAESVAISAVAYAEARSAFARLEREGDIRAGEHREAVAALDEDWRAFLRVLDVTRRFSILAGRTAAKHSLRGFDAVHLASAVAIRAVLEQRYARALESGGTETRAPEVFFYTYDGRLGEAARREVHIYEPPSDGGEEPS